MASELECSFLSGRVVYFLIRTSTGAIWNGSATVVYSTADYSDYKVTGTEQGSASGFYTGTMPTGLTGGVYNIVAKQQIGGSPAESDPTIAMGTFQWTGTIAAALADTATSGQVGQIAPIKMARGVMVQNFQFKLVSSADHITPFTSGVVSGQIARDSGNFGPLQSGTVTEIGLGFYRVNLTSGDLTANTAGLNFSANGISGGSSDPKSFALVFQRVSGSP